MSVAGYIFKNAALFLPQKPSVYVKVFFLEGVKPTLFETQKVETKEGEINQIPILGPVSLETSVIWVKLKH